MLKQFFAMGGYAFYVWGAYGIALLLLGGCVVFSRLSYTRELKAYHSDQ